MCLTTRNPEIKVAEKDITVYKDGCLYKDGLTFEVGHSNYEYEINKDQEPVVLTPIDQHDGTFTVEEGYHSHARTRGAFSHSECNGKFVIPKGTKYIHGWYNDRSSIPNYVSENIVYVGPTKPTVKFKWKLFTHNLKKQFFSWITKK